MFMINAYKNEELQFFIDNRKKRCLIFNTILALMLITIILFFLEIITLRIFYIFFTIALLLNLTILFSKIIEIHIFETYMVILEQSLLNKILNKKIFKTTINFNSLLKIKFYYIFPKMVNILFINQQGEFTHHSVPLYLLTNKEIMKMETVIRVGDYQIL